MRQTVFRPAGPDDDDFLWSMLFETCRAAEQGHTCPADLRAIPDLAAMSRTLTHLLDWQPNTDTPVCA
ncbi:hypothetical protein [Nocardia sp. CY41]|uniref:hypothetical protein n=1 Tax=Nocardia sp. CY41 TaxID=2608686 RepID=UPI0013581FC9|nr:hypothetical protein [Nocardia sp. CY41]